MLLCAFFCIFVNVCVIILSFLYMCETIIFRGIWTDYDAILILQVYDEKRLMIRKKHSDNSKQHLVAGLKGNNIEYEKTSQKDMQMLDHAADGR